MRFQVASTLRSAALRSNILSLAKTCSIGLRSGLQYSGPSTMFLVVGYTHLTLYSISASISKPERVNSQTRRRRFQSDHAAEATLMRYRLSRAWALDHGRVLAPSGTMIDNNSDDDW